MYFEARDDVVKKLDFPKGKANQNEDDVACAIREIKEEIDVDVTKYIRADQYISVQTMKAKTVKLFVIAIDEELINTKLKRVYEVQAAEWIPVNKFMCEALKFGMQNPNSSAIAMANN